MKFLRYLLCALLLIPVSADAWYKGVGGGPTGSSNMNVAGGAFFGPNAVDFIKGGRWFLTTATDIQFLNASGYMNGTPAGTFNYVMDSGSAWANVNYTWEWDAGIKFNWTLQSSIANCVTVNATVTSGCATFNATVVASNGLAGSMTFDHATTASFVLAGSNSGTYAAPPGAGMRIYRTSDKARVLAGTIIAPEYQASISGTGSRWLRPMLAVMQGIPSGGQQQSDEALWINRHQLTDTNWTPNQYSSNNIPMGVTCGNAIACGTDTYTADASANVTGSSWNDGDVTWLVFQNTNTVAPTFAQGSRPPVPICDQRGNLITSAGAISTSAANGSTLTYNARLGCVLYHQGAPNVGVPIEAMVKYANVLNMGLWRNVPYPATDNYVTQDATYILNNLQGAIPWGYEFCNELWNPAFNCNQWAQNQGYALGFVLGSGGASFGFQGLRSRQISGIVASIFGSNNPRVYPIIANQVGAANNNIKNIALGGSNLKNNFTITSGVTFTVGTPCQVLWAFNGFGSPATQVSFTGTTLPTGITSAQLYYVVNNTNNNSPSTTFNLANTQGGSPIACSGTASGITGSYVNTLYNAAIGVDYSTVGNRPGDPPWSRISSGAPYSNGANMCNSLDAGCGSTLPAATAPFWQNLVTTWEGNPTSGNSAALALIDYDLRWGRVSGSIQNVTCSSSTFTTPSPHGYSVNTVLAFEVTGGTICTGVAAHTIYCVASTPLSTTFTLKTFVNGICNGSTVTASAGSGATTVGTVPYQNILALSGTWFPFSESYADPFGLINAWYEGAIEIPSLTAAQCVALSITTSPVDGTGALCASETAAVVLAYKNDPLARQLEFDYMACGVGLLSDCVMTFGQMPNAKWSSNLTLAGGTIYALTPSITGTPYQLYNGFHDFNALNLH